MLVKPMEPGVPTEMLVMFVMSPTVALWGIQNLKIPKKIATENWNLKDLHHID